MRRANLPWNRSMVFLSADEGLTGSETRFWSYPITEIQPVFRVFRRNQYALLTHYRFAAVCLLQRNARFTDIFTVMSHALWDGLLLRRDLFIAEKMPEEQKKRSVGRRASDRTHRKKQMAIENRIKTMKRKLKRDWTELKAVQALGLLVSLNWTHYCAYIDDLSNS